MKVFSGQDTHSFPFKSLIQSHQIANQERCGGAGNRDQGLLFELYFRQRCGAAMPRSSRHRSHKHSSRDATDYSDSEDDSGSRESRGGAEESDARAKDSGLSERRSLRTFTAPEKGTTSRTIAP